MLDNLFGQTIAKLSSALDSSALKQRVIASNIANINTPGYKRSDVEFGNVFDKELRNAKLQTSLPQHLSLPPWKSKGYELVTDNNSSMRADGNNVDPEIEMAQLADTEIRFAALADITGKRFRSLQTVITGQPR